MTFQRRCVFKNTGFTKRIKSKWHHQMHIEHYLLSRQTVPIWSWPSSSDTEQHVIYYFCLIEFLWLKSCFAWNFWWILFISRSSVFWRRAFMFGEHVNIEMKWRNKTENLKNEEIKLKLKLTWCVFVCFISTLMKTSLKSSQWYHWPLAYCALVWCWDVLSQVPKMFHIILTIDFLSFSATCNDFAVSKLSNLLHLSHLPSTSDTDIHYLFTIFCDFSATTRESVRQINLSTFSYDSSLTKEGLCTTTHFIWFFFIPEIRWNFSTLSSMVRLKFCNFLVFSVFLSIKFF